MNDVVRLQPAQVGSIAPFVLWHHRSDVLDVLHYILTLLISKVGQAFMLSYGLVSEQTYDYIAILGALVDNVDQPRMHDVSNHA